MGVARQHGETRAFTRGHSKHQEDAHKILVEAGFEFDRQSGKTKNIYRHADGRRIGVNATPRNPSVDLAYIKQSIHAPLQEGQVGTRRENDVATTPKQSPTTPLVAMADPFLLKEQTTKHGRAARNAALAKYVERVLAKHGPMPAKLLEEACVELGFARHHVIKARGEASAVAWRVGGRQVGWVVGLESQIPEGASVYGRESAPKNGVAVEVGENNGAGPEPREEPAEAPVTDTQKIDAMLKNLVEDASENDMAKAATPPLVLKPMSEPALKPLMSTIPEAGSDVEAAAQLLLSSLGLRTAHPRMGEGLDSLDEFLGDLEWRLGQARERLHTLKGLLS